MGHESTHDRWFEDHRSVGRVDWPEGLRDKTTAKMKSAAKKKWRWLLTPPLFFGAGCLIAAVGHHAGLRPATDFGAFGFIGLSALLFIPAILRANDFRKLQLLYRKILGDNTLEVFERAPHVDENLDAMRALGQQVKSDEIPRALFIHSNASAILQLDDTVLLKPEVIDIREVPRPISPEPQTRSVTPFGERALTQHELAELQECVRLNWKVVVFFFGGFGVLSILLILSVLAIFGVGGLELELWEGISAVLWALLWLWMSYTILGPYRSQRRVRAALKRDLAGGVVDVMPGHEAVRLLREQGLPREELPSATPSAVHRLAESGFWWEVDGTPALWRRV